MSNIKAISTIFIVLVAMLFFFKDTDTSHIQTTKLSSTAKILAFGDSLTYGKGAPLQSYPMQLQKLIKKEVINAGLSGEPSTRGLQRLPSLLEAHKPELVIICHGGNDIIRQTSKQTLKDNLVKMIRLSKKSGAQVLLVGVPDFKLIRFSTLSLYEEVAEQEEVLYEGHILSKIENDNALKSDRIHPNAKGYGLMAEEFFEVLQENDVL